MTCDALRLAGAALLYGAIFMGANPAHAQSLDEAGMSEVEAMRSGDMEKLVFHAPYDPIEETWKDENGNRVSFEDYRGTVVVANFWATWCPPCRAEMPSLDRLAGLMPDTDLVVVPISGDRGDPGRIVDFFAEIGVQNLGVHHDKPGKVMRRAGVLGLPMTAILDRDGREIARLVGDAEWDSPAAQAILKRIVELTVPGGLKDASRGAGPAKPAG